MRPVVRRDLVEALTGAIADVDIDLIHLHGMAGAGKTTAVTTLAESNPRRICIVDAEDPAIQNPDEIVRVVAHSLLTEKDYLDWVELTRRIATEDRRHLEANARYELNNQGTINAPLVVTGPLIVTSPTEVARERHRELEARVRALAVIAKKRGYGRFVLVIDRLERLQAEESRAWLESTLLTHASRYHGLVQVMTVSRHAKTLTCPTHATCSLSVGSLSDAEADELLVMMGITGDDQRAHLKQLTRCHAMALRLAGRLVESVDLSAMNLQSVDGRVYEELIVELLLKSVIEVEPEGPFADALRRLPVFRILTPESVRFLLQCSAEAAGDVTEELRRRGFVVERDGIFFYHDLLRELTLRYVDRYHGRQRLLELHRKAIEFYQSGLLDERFRIVRLVEPYHHLMCASTGEADAYFEHHIKYALDRGDRLLASAFLSQVDHSTLHPGPRMGWYLLRIGGYHREFRQLDQAIQILQQIPDMAATDPRLLASALNNIGWCLLFHPPRDNLRRAVALFRESNAICEANGLGAIYARNLNNLGIAYSSLHGDASEKAMDCYRKAIALCEADGSKDLLLVAAMGYRNVAFGLKKRKRHEDAVAAFEKSIALYVATGSARGAAETLLALVETCESRMSASQARGLLDHAYVTMRAQDHQDPVFMSRCLLALGRTFARLGNEKLMKECFAQACLSSLEEGWAYHEFLVARLVACMRFVAAVAGGPVAASTLRSVGEHWTGVFGEKGQALVNLLSPWAAAAESTVAWSLGDRLPIHRPGSPSCTPARWADVVLLSEASATASRRWCRRCARAVEQRQALAASAQNENPR